MPPHRRPTDDDTALPTDVWLLRFADRVCEISPTVDAAGAMRAALRVYPQSRHLTPESAAEMQVLAARLPSAFGPPPLARPSPPRPH